MKSIKLFVTLFIILFAFACNKPQSEKAENDSFIEETQATEDVITKEVDKTKKVDITKNKEIKTREELVKEILTTSPRYKQLTKGLLEAIQKNGGQFYGILLEGSPNPQQDNALRYSKTYDYTLYEMYKEREVNTSRFSFNPQNKQLYEYDAVNSKLALIEFDKNLLIEYESLSK